MTNTNLKPFLKWAGGKRQLLPVLKTHVPSTYTTYFEPFLGAGSVLFELQPKNAVINDTNKELINCYLIIKNHIEELITLLKKHQNLHTEDYYYTIRNIDRDTKKFKKLTNIERAARIIYLNKTCFNGLFRENSKGQYNTPYGKYTNPKILDEPTLRSIHTYLSTNNIQILNVDFVDAVKSAKAGDFVYFDPPYDPINKTSSFTSYSKGGFSKADQERLKDLFEELHRRGCFVMLSNSSTAFIQELYQGQTLHLIDAARSINSVGGKRGKVKEVLVLSFK